MERRVDVLLSIPETEEMLSFLVFLITFLARLVCTSEYAEARVRTWVEEVSRFGDGSTGYILSNNASVPALVLAERSNNASFKEI